MNPLADLHDIVTPEAVGWWPLAWGWWVLVLLLLIGIVVALWCWQQRKLRQRTRTLAIAELTQYYQNLPAHTPANYTTMNTIVKRAVLQLWPQAEVASLHGIDWLRFLIAEMPTHRRNAFAESLLAFQHRLYQPASATDSTLYYELLQEWLLHALPAKMPDSRQPMAKEVKSNV